MKTFSQFIVESDDALNRLNQRRQNAKEKNKKNVQSFKKRSTQKIMNNKQKNLRIQQEYERKQQTQRNRFA